MKKWQIILLILMATITMGATQVQISEDNTTWESIEITKWGGVIDESANISVVHLLETETTYYFRIKDDSTDWNYYTTTTGGNQMSIALMMGILGIAAIFLIIAFNIEQEHFTLKILSLLFTLITLFLIPNAALNGTSGTTITNLIRIVGGYFFAFIIYVVFYMSWHAINKMRETS